MREQKEIAAGKSAGVETLIEVASAIKRLGNTQGIRSF
jgi:hypothetical protein